jgi:hypothetical protein
VVGRKKAEKVEGRLLCDSIGGPAFVKGCGCGRTAVRQNALVELFGEFEPCVRTRGCARRTIASCSCSRMRCAASSSSFLSMRSVCQAESASAAAAVEAVFTLIDFVALCAVRFWEVGL